MPKPTKRKVLERVLTPYLLLIINIMIIFMAEIIGHGKLFYETGLIHGIAIVFILLAAYRIFQKYYIFDPELQKLLRASMFAQAFFALSHFVEFASFQIFHLYNDAAFANVCNFYIVSLLCLGIGAEFVLVTRNKNSKKIIWAIIVAMAGFLALTIAFVTKKELISLDANEVAPYAYALAISGAGIYSIIRLWTVSKMYPLLRPFVTYLIQATVLIILAALPNVFYDILGNLGMDQYQIIYLSHFTFYAALSLMFLAYGDSLKVGGVHEDIRNAVEEGRMELKG